MRLCTKKRHSAAHGSSTRHIIVLHAVREEGTAAPKRRDNRAPLGPQRVRQQQKTVVQSHGRGARWASAWGGKGCAAPKEHAADGRPDQVLHPCVGTPQDKSHRKGTNSKSPRRPPVRQRRASPPKCGEPRGAKSRKAYTTEAACAPQTLRPPAGLSAAAATVAELSHGRLHARAPQVCHPPRAWKCSPDRLVTLASAVQCKICSLTNADF